MPLASGPSTSPPRIFHPAAFSLQYISSRIGYKRTSWPFPRYFEVLRTLVALDAARRRSITGAGRATCPASAPPPVCVPSVDFPFHFLVIAAVPVLAHLLFHLRNPVKQRLTLQSLWQGLRSDGVFPGKKLHLRLMIWLLGKVPGNLVFHVTIGTVLVFRLVLSGIDQNRIGGQNRHDSAKRRQHPEKRGRGGYFPVGKDTLIVPAGGILGAKALECSGIGEQLRVAEKRSA